VAATPSPGVPPLLNAAERARPIHWRILALSWLGWLSVFSTLMVFFFLSGLYRLELGLDDRAVAWIKSCAIGATGVGGLVLGLLGDRRGRRAAMVVSLALCAAGVAGAALATSAAWMTAAATLAGFGIGGQWASGQTLLGETVPPALRARFGALAQSGAPLGLVLATLAAFELGPRIGWRAVFVLALTPALLVPALFLLIPESDLWRALRERVSRGEAPERVTLRELFAPDVRRSFLAAFLLTLLCMANYWFTVSWLPDFMHRTWDLTLARSGQWTLVFVAGSLCGYLLFALVAERTGRRPAFSLFCAVMAAGTAMLTVFEAAIRDEPALVLLFAFVAGVGTGVWSSFGPLYTELFPTRVRATASGVCMNVSRGIQFLAPLLVVIVGGQDLRSGVALAAVFAAAAGVVIWLLPDRPGRRLEIG
jgi:MFS family permease